MATKRTSKLGDELIESAREIVAHVRGEIALPVRYVKVPDRVDVRAIREKSGLSQAAFAKGFGFNARSLQDWEQGRRRPDAAVRAYLKVIATDPDAVRRALAG